MGGEELQLELGEDEDRNMPFKMRCANQET
jgi:hypothetical protein